AFTHWLIAIRKPDWVTKGRGYTGRIDCWKISPGENASNWNACREGGYIAIGWEALGDVGGLTRQEFRDLRDSLVTSDRSWSARAIDQVWHFARIPEGSRIVANRGTTEVLGVGSVKGPYYYVPDERYGHRLPVEWTDTSVRSVEEPGWKRTMVKLDSEKLARIQGQPGVDSSTLSDGKAGWVKDAVLRGPAFTERTFEVLDRLHETPTKEFYDNNKEALYEHLVTPFKALMNRAGELLPQSIREVMETEKRIFGNILKQFSKYGCWDYYWGAFYPKGGRRTEDAQLFTVLRPDGLEYGFCTGDYSSEQTDRLVRNLTTSRARVKELLGDVLADPDIMLGARDEEGDEETPQLSFDQWIASDDEDDLSRAAKAVPREQLLSWDPEDLAQDIARTFEALFPFVLMAIEDNPWPTVAGYLEVAVAEEHDVAPESAGVYDLGTFVADTGFSEEEIASWERRLRRKKHVIFQGPPGTGKTYVAERLARMLVSGTRGFWEVVQFHPSYAYEDFMQGLRPTPVAGGLSFKLEPGRFLDFCARARTEAQGDPCVLLIDEINRAHLSRVFGELMYLLEYRHQEIPLASGGRPFKIPENVYLIGTMNTADRSIALVDHALRRRFSFIRLSPEYNVLSRHLEEYDLDSDSLVSVLRKVNEAIGDSNYEIGSSYFMKDDGNLPDVLGDIWVGEIEPYLEEFFYDNVSKVDVFRWETLQEGELSDWVE
ncbi:MAG: AAA family ATPase, partial [Chloroflexi bacterium]|nr:AAA family ATPase [Chloroflexota bacterium]